MKRTRTDKKIEHIEELIEQLYAEMAALSPPQQAMALRRLYIKMSL
jgi:hypothetical protein